MKLNFNIFNRDKQENSEAMKKHDRYENLLAEYNQVKQEVDLARQNFENAEPDYIEIANHELSAKVLKLDNIIKKLKAGNF